MGGDEAKALVGFSPCKVSTTVPNWTNARRAATYYDRGYRFGGYRAIDDAGSEPAAIRRALVSVPGGAVSSPSWWRRLESFTDAVTLSVWTVQIPSLHVYTFTRNGGVPIVNDAAVALKNGHLHTVRQNRPGNPRC